MRVSVSVCIATYDRPEVLLRVLRSVRSQTTEFDYEVVVVDDGTPNPERYDRCRELADKFVRIERSPGWRNPAAARNEAFRLASGEIFICQSDDVEHVGNAIQSLVDVLEDNPKSFVVAEVWNVDPDTGKPVPCHGRWWQLTGPQEPHKRCPRPRRPLFFLGAVRQEHVYAVGGYDEEFTGPDRDDVWFADCLIHGAHVYPIYTDRAVGHHLHHGRKRTLLPGGTDSKQLYQQKALQARRTGYWRATVGL